MRILYVLLVLAIAAVAIDDPARWQQGSAVLRHAAWDGLAPADLVTPIFVFFLGAAIPICRRRATTSTVLIGAALLLAAGLAINGLCAAGLSTWRFPGVLQRAAITFAVAVVADGIVSGDS